MQSQSIILTTDDHERLSQLIAENGYTRNAIDAAAFAGLAKEVKRAKIVMPDEIPDNVVTMNSSVFVKDLDSGEKMRMTICWPEQVNPQNGMINVLAPLGTALLGTQVGEVVEWVVPSGLRKLKVCKIFFQPEAKHKGNIGPSAASS